MALAAQCGLLAQTNALASQDGKAPTLFALEKLVVDPQEIGVDAKRTIEGMVINVKSPVKVIANDREQSLLVTTSEFRETNLRFANYGMHSWMSINYKITEEEGKNVTLYVLEFESPKHARKFFGAVVRDDDEATNQDQELKGSIFYQYMHGSIVLKATWQEPKTAGIDRILDAYKTKLMAF